MARDFSSITELPGRKIGQDQFEIICRRYYFAAEFIEGKRILEVGCGPGLGLGYFASKARLVVAGDVTGSNVSQAWNTYRDRNTVKLLQMDAQALPFKEGCFDVVVVMAALYYFDFETLLHDCLRVLPGDGVLIFCLPNKNARGFKPSRFGRAYYSPPELLSLLRRNGFQLEMFGVFPVSKGKKQWEQKFVEIGGTALTLLDFVPHLKRWLKDALRILIGYKTYVLPTELTESDMINIQDIPISPLPLDRHSDAFRVLYGLGRKCECEIRN